MNNSIIKEDFWLKGANGDTSLKIEDLGWPMALKSEAQSDYPETIFRQIVEVMGFNLLFYWTLDENFYVIETEKSPIEVRKIFPNPNWDGKFEFQKAASNSGPNTASPGEILAMFDSPTKIWSELKINGISIEEVIEKSLIVTWD